MKKPKTKPARVNFPLHFDEGMREIADRRSCLTDRCNITAYINRLIREDGERNPKARNTKS